MVVVAVVVVDDAIVAVVVVVVAKIHGKLEYFSKFSSCTFATLNKSLS